MHSLSVAGGLVGLASIPLNSIRIPLAMDGTVGTHTCSDGVISGSLMAPGSVTPHGDGSDFVGEAFSPTAVGSGCHF